MPFLLLGAIGCASPPVDAPPLAARPRVPAAPLPAAIGDAGATPTADAASGRASLSETACNGADDDGDGLVDVLLPRGPNVCTTHQKGACNVGFAGCDGKTRRCYVPPPMPEVHDDIDNDCNGVVDDVPPKKTRSRALVIAPRYAWTEAAVDIANVTSVLAQAGIPFDRQPTPDWKPTLEKLDEYPLVIVPGYLSSPILVADVRERLAAWVEAGGVLVLFKPLATATSKHALDLAGLRASKRIRTAHELRFDGDPAPLVAELDSPEERALRINADGPRRAPPGKKAPPGVELYVYEPAPGTQTIARAYERGEALGSTITRRTLGKGAVYAFGHDLTSFGASRCYMNCFEPSGDVLRLVLRGMLREATAGHTVMLHTAPKGHAATVAVTHDADQPESFATGDWGDPAVKQIADLERKRGTRASFFVSAGKGGHYDAAVARELCLKGTCALAAHGASQPRTFATLPFGTCKETTDTYRGAPTLCGEVRVALDVLAGLGGKAPRAWRSPFLALHPAQYSVLARNGIAFDSGFGIGDLPYNLPVDLASIGIGQERFRHQPLLELPIALEDELTIEGDSEERLVLDDRSRSRFESIWRYVLLRNVQNGSMTTLNVRASRGSRGSAEAIPAKLRALEHFLDEAERADTAIWTIEELGDFWRARLATTLDVTYDQARGYEGAIAFAPNAAGIGVDFGDRISRFECDACGPARIEGKRVVFLAPPAAGGTAKLLAHVR